MEYTTKDKLYLISIIVAYVLLGIMGIYSTTLFFLFPILSIPFTVYLIRRKSNIKRNLLIHLGVMGLLILFKVSLNDMLLYLVVVAVPAHLFYNLYSKRTPLPKMIMYIGTGTMGAFFLYVVIMKYIGIDYVAYYLMAVDEYKKLQFEMINEISSLVGENADLSYLTTLKEFIYSQIIILKSIYPALFLIMGILLASIQMFIMVGIGYIKKWQMPPLRQLGQFTFSKIVGALLILSIVFSQGTIENSNEITILGTNIFFFAGTLLQFLGIIIVLLLIRKTRWHRGMKILAIFVILSLFSFFSPAFILVGLIDSLFNVRKMKIIV